MLIAFDENGNRLRNAARTLTIVAVLTLGACGGQAVSSSDSAAPSPVATPEVAESVAPVAMTGAEVCSDAQSFIDESLYGGATFLLGLFDYAYKPKLNEPDAEMMARVGRDAQGWADLSEDPELRDAFTAAADYYGMVAESPRVNLDMTGEAINVAAIVSDRCQILASRSDLEESGAQ